MRNKTLLKNICYLGFLLGIVSCTENGPNKIDERINTPGESSLTSHADAPIDIVLTIDGGNHFFSLIIGSDSAKVARNYDSTETYLDSADKSYNHHKHVLSEGAVNHIWKYIQDHCTPTDGKMPFSGSFYNIGRVSDTPLYKTGCKVESIEQGIKYFSELIKWIENSPYKAECKYLIADIQAKFIEGKPFPFTPQVQRILDSMKRRKTK